MIRQEVNLYLISFQFHFMNKLLNLYIFMNKLFNFYVFPILFQKQNFLFVYLSNFTSRTNFPFFIYFQLCFTTNFLIFISFQFRSMNIRVGRKRLFSSNLTRVEIKRRVYMRKSA